jgi:hypothetical protein
MFGKKPEKDPTPLPTERSGIFKVGEGILINKDVSALEAYKKRKRKMQDIDDVKKAVEDIQGDLEIIKKLLVEKLK